MQRSRWFRVLTGPAVAALVVAMVVASAAPALGSIVFAQGWGTFGTGPGQFDHAGADAVDTAGNVYVADTLNSRVQVFDPTGTFLRELGSKGTGNGQFLFPVAVAVDPTGNIYVSDMQDAHVTKFAPDGTFLTKWGGPGVLSAPTFLALDEANNVYVTDSKHLLVKKFDANGTLLTSWELPGGTRGRGRPEGIVVSGGSVYVADSTYQRVLRFTTAGNLMGLWGTEGTGPGQFQRPTALAADVAGNIYVADSDNNRIQKLTADGQFLAQVGTWGTGPGQFWEPIGVAVRANGDVYVSEWFGNRVQRFVQQGSITIVTQADPTHPQDFTFTVGAQPFVLDDDPNSGLPDSITFGGLDAGSYTFTEAVIAGWDLTDISCTTPETIELAARHVIVGLEFGEDVTCTFTNTAHRQPDGEIRKTNNGADFVGLGVTNVTGAGQTTAASRSGGKSADYRVRVHNAGAVADDLVLSGSGSAPGFKVRYFAAGTEVTEQILTGTYTVPGVDPGDRAALRVRVRVKKAAGAGDVQDVLVTATSASLPDRADAVRALTTAKS